MLNQSEAILDSVGENLIGKDILEIGCAYGERCFLMARYEGTKVHGIDVDEYTVNQSPDLNEWNPEDIQFIHNKLDDIRKKLSYKFPSNVSSRVTFQTCGAEHYVTENPHDVIVSWDVLEHILNLPEAFNAMYHSVKKGGLVFHEYNPFFSFSGGHSLCTLDFHFGHCRLSGEEVEQYIRELRPNEEKIAKNFYNRCLNRFSISDVKKFAVQSGFEIIKIDGHNPFTQPNEAKQEIIEKILPDVRKHYHNVEIEDLLWDSVQLILRKK
jgi:SAM-dependent methyltransferase